MLEPETPVSLAAPALTGAQVPPANWATYTLAVPLERSIHATTGPAAVSTITAWSATPVLLIPPAFREEPSATQPPRPPLAAGSNCAASRSFELPVNSVHATMG